MAGGQELACSKCGTEISGEQLIFQLNEQIDCRRKRYEELQGKISKAKQSLQDLVKEKQCLASLWNKVLLARAQVKSAKQAYSNQRKQNTRELEAVQLLTKENKKRDERLRRVRGKDFCLKETRLSTDVMEDKRVAAEKSVELVSARKAFITGLYQKIFPIEVLPLSSADAGAEDYVQSTKIDCDKVLELDEGWVLGGIHCHPTPYISIVAPSLPANGDQNKYLHSLAERTKHKGVVPSKAVHPMQDPYLSTPAALVYVAQFVELIAWVLDQPLPFPLQTPVTISEYGSLLKRKKTFLSSMAKLDDDIVYLCFTQNVPCSALGVRCTLQNLLALVTHTHLGRTGAFECYPELVSYSEASFGLLTGTGRPALLSSHDLDDNQPPNISYTTDSASLSADSEGEEAAERDWEREAFDVTDGPGMEWEHLDPSEEDACMFEEEQMKRALQMVPTLSSTRNRQEHEQERAERRRRLDYDSTYMDYAALLETTSATASVHKVADKDDLRASPPPPSSPSNLQQQQQQQQQTGGILGTLSSLWTSTFGGSSS